MNMQPKPPSWFVVSTRPSSEKNARDDMVKKGFTVCLPLFKKEFQHKRSKKWVTNQYPLMVGYLFVLGSPDWVRLLKCDDVTGVLRSRHDGEDGDPVAVPDEKVQAIRLACEAGEFDELKVHGHTVKIGDTLKVAEGSLAGMEGLVTSVKSQKNIKILLSILGRAVEATIPIANLGRKG